MKLLVPRAVTGLSETPRADRPRCMGTLRIQQTRATTNSNHFRFTNTGQILIPAWVLWEFHRKRKPNPMGPSLPKIKYSAIEGGGGRLPNRTSLSPVSSSTAGVRQRCGSLPVEYVATHPSTRPPDLTRIFVLSKKCGSSTHSAIRRPGAQ